MTQDEWLRFTDPDLMLSALADRVSERKVRLFAVACCRRAWPLLADSHSRRAIETAERYADGEVTRSQLARARAKVRADTQGADLARCVSHRLLSAVRSVPWQVVLLLYDFPNWVSDGQSEDVRPELQAHCALLRDIVGNPDRRTVLRAGWLAWEGGTVVKFAQAVYESQRWEDLPILADALEDAGCDDPEMLAHCRGSGPHSRGCWVVDTLLQKS